MKKIISVAAAASIAFVASPAFAQDEAAFAGPYVGVTLGASSLDANFVDGYENFALGSANDSKTGLVYGVTAGYNLPVGSNGLIGVEADFNGNTARVRRDFNDWESHIRQSNPWFATVRARAGLTTGNALFYATGGLAIVRNNNKAFYYNDAPCGTYTYGEEVCKATTDVGLAFGAGAEIALNANVSVKGEYLHVNSGTQRHVATDANNDYDYVSFTNKQDIARVGFNYKF